VALGIGTHVPLWPLYLWWAAGRQVFPVALLTVALTPVFLVIPTIARRSGLIGRVAMLLAGVANTVLTMWVLGQNTGTDLFFVACAGLAAIVFRRRDRWLMLVFALFPLGVWYWFQLYPLVALHHFGAHAAHQIVILNAFSVGVLFALFGWLQANIYRRMELPDISQPNHPPECAVAPKN
jgi:hypothetical protein